jgi:hypothetical protein
VYVNSTNYIAQQFTTSSGPVQLVSVIASLGQLDPGSGGFSLVAQLVADNNNTPTGSVLTTFTYDPTKIPTSGYANVEFDPTSSVNLQSNTSYWFELQGRSSDGSGLVYWQYTLSVDHYGPGSLPNGAMFFTDPPGQSWQVFANEPSLIQVNVVPEPSSVVLGCIALGLVMAVSPWTKNRRRRD